MTSLKDKERSYLISMVIAGDDGVNEWSRAICQLDDDTSLSGVCGDEERLKDLVRSREPLVTEYLPVCISNRQYRKMTKELELASAINRIPELLGILGSMDTIN